MVYLVMKKKERVLDKKDDEDQAGIIVFRQSGLI